MLAHANTIDDEEVRKDFVEMSRVIQASGDRVVAANRYGIGMESPVWLHLANHLKSQIHVLSAKTFNPGIPAEPSEVTLIVISPKTE